jgi:hypothetical protein
MNYTEKTTRALYSQTTEWRKWNDETLHNLYLSLNIKIINTKIRWVRHVACIQELKNTYKTLFRKLKGKR